LFFLKKQKKKKKTTTKKQKYIKNMIIIGTQTYVILFVQLKQTRLAQM